MPNTEVKLTNAESTWPEAAREDRKLLIKEKDLQRCESFLAYRTFCVGFDTDEVRYYLVSSVFYLFPKKIKSGQNELVKSLKTIAMTALNRVISF